MGPEAEGSSDLAALVCRVATVVDPRGRNDRLYELKSSLETHLEKTQIELALSQLRALVQVDPVSNVEEVSVALDKCKKMEIPSDLAHELVSFQGRTMSHFVEQMKSTPRQSPAWDAECKLTNEVMLSSARCEVVRALGARRCRSVARSAYLFTQLRRVPGKPGHLARRRHGRSSARVHLGSVGSPFFDQSQAC